MAKPKSAQKRHKQSLARRSRNRHVRSSVRTAIKSVRSALESKEAHPVQEALSQAVSVIARAGSKGVLKKKTASRKIARLSRAAHQAAAKG